MTLFRLVEPPKILDDPANTGGICVPQRPTAEWGKTSSHDHCKIDIPRVLDDPLLQTPRCLVDH